MYVGSCFEGFIVRNTMVFNLAVMTFFKLSKCLLYKLFSTYFSFQQHACGGETSNKTTVSLNYYFYERGVGVPCAAESDAGRGGPWAVGQPDATHGVQKIIYRFRTRVGNIGAWIPSERPDCNTPRAPASARRRRWGDAVQCVSGYGASGGWRGANDSFEQDKRLLRAGLPALARSSAGQTSFQMGCNF